jgi:hypothetical protein
MALKLVELSKEQREACDEMMQVIKKYTGKHRPWRKSRYKVSDKAWDQRFISQRGRCAICGTLKYPYKGPVVDHDCITKKIRGILCLKCNTGIAALRHDPAIFEKAILYLSSQK